MDVQMPKMSGLEASAQIREAQQKSGHPIPIVAMTAHAMSGDRELCLGAGMDDYIAKPVAPKDLLAKLDRLLNSSTPSAGPADDSATLSTMAVRVISDKSRES
jgi:CheY-like chemotaxis protein